MMRDGGSIRNSTGTKEYDKTTERQYKYIEASNLSRHYFLPFYSRQVTIASLQGLRGLVFSWPAGTIHTMSVPEAGANEQDLFLINPGLVFDSSWTCL